MRIGVLVQPGSWYLADLCRAAGQRHELVPLAFELMRGDVSAAGPRIDCGGVDLFELDALLVRTMPPGSLEQVVLRMDMLGQVAAAGTPVWNSPRAVECAVDKYLTSVRMQAAGLLVPKTRACQTAEDALQAFEEFGRDVVVKPLFGGEGRGITRISDPDLALRAFRLLAQLQTVIYVQQFIAHDGGDIRVFLLGDQAWAMRRWNPLDWRSNIGRGARAEPLTPSAQMLDLARRAATAVGADIAGVDLLPGPGGELYAIEVNAVPGWKALARAVEVDIAEQLLSFVERNGRGNT